jgi:intracellular septation protein
MQLQIDAHVVGYDTRMNQLLEFSPLIVFLAGFELFGIYWATAALMVACVLQLLVHRLRAGKFKTMHIITVAVVLVLGSATLLLHDRRFIQWKPTVLLGLGAAAFLGSMVVGKQPLARRMLEAAFNEPLQVRSRTWLLINVLWAGWLALLAAANIYVAWNFTESAWVHFKVYGITVALFIFMLPQVLWLSGKTKTAQSDRSSGMDRTGSSREQRLRERLESRFAPVLLSIEDEGHLHAGHAGAAGGLGHFRITIVAEAFRGVSQVARHRLVYAAVDDLLKTDIHALAIEASPPPG